MELSDQERMDNPSSSATMNEAKAPSTSPTSMIEEASSNPPRSLEENTSEERKEWRGRNLPETLSKVYEFLKRSDTSHEEALKALHRTPYFPVNIRDKYSRALKRLEAATQDLQTATTTPTTSGGTHVETNEEPLVSAEVSAADRPQDLDNMSFAQIYPLLNDDSQRCLDEMADDSSEEKRLKFAKQYFGQQAKTEAKLQASVDKADARVAALQASVENEKANADAEVAKSDAAEILLLMQKTVHSIKTALNYLAGLSQANASTTGNDFGTGTNEMIEKEAKEGMKDTTAAGETPEHIHMLLLPENIIEIPLEDLLRDIETGRRIAYNKLKKVAGAWEAWVSKSKVIDSKDASMKDKVKRGIEWMSHHIKDTDVDIEGPELDEELWFPNMVSGDVNAFPPVVMELLSQIGFCLEGLEAPLHGSPSKTQGQQNRSIPPTTHHRNKIADRGVLKPLISDCARKLVVDMSPFDKESLDQNLSHLAKYLSQCLDFHGHGAPSFATGLTATLTHVKVVQLCLDLYSFCPETETMARIKLHISPRLPLMTKQSFNE